MRTFFFTVGRSLCNALGQVITSCSWFTILTLQVIAILFDQAACKHAHRIELCKRNSFILRMFKNAAISSFESPIITSLCLQFVVFLREYKSPAIYGNDIFPHEAATLRNNYLNTCGSDNYGQLSIPVSPSVCLHKLDRISIGQYRYHQGYRWKIPGSAGFLPWKHRWVAEVILLIMAEVSLRSFFQLSHVLKP